ncbi:hypothetical protein UPYG_G00110140 [Umbra pygmaea]|uniref:Myb-like domain-containing protein n=1 Tax=Umbra pygmaea TaxID=75934 RepID=A0ABD0X2Q8_UMBPY
MNSEHCDIVMEGKPEIERFHLERQRKKRFDEEELNILFCEVQARQPGPGYNSEAQATWEVIAAKVSSSSGQLRTGIQCKKRYNDLIRREPSYIKRIRRAKANRGNRQTVTNPHPPEDDPGVSFKTESFNIEFVDSDVDGEGLTCPVEEFQNEVDSTFLGAELYSPQTNHVDDEQTLDTAVCSQTKKVHPSTDATSHWPSLHQNNLQPRVNIVRLKLEPDSKVSTSQVNGATRNPKPQTNTTQVTVQPHNGLLQEDAPLNVNVARGLPQQAAITRANQSRPYIPQSNQSQACMSQDSVHPQLNAPSVNQASVHIPVIEVQPHIQVQPPPQDLAALVQVHQHGYNMLQRELVSMRGSMVRVLQPLLTSINNNLERLANAVERLSGVKNTPQTNVDASP